MSGTMPTLYDRIIRQLDTLISFLALAREDAFGLIRSDQGSELTTEQLDSLPHSYQEFRCQVSHSAFLLGYSYFEAFLSDLVREILLRRPNILPQERELKYRDVLDRKDYDSILKYMIDKEILAIFYGSAEKIGKYFEDRLNLPWPEYDGQPAVVRASLVRNCIIHNGARVDSRLSEISDWDEGDQIELSPGDVHSFGLQARDFARQLWTAAVANHFRQSNEDRSS